MSKKGFDGRLSLLQSHDVGKPEECLDRAFNQKHFAVFRKGNHCNGKMVVVHDEGLMGINVGFSKEAKSDKHLKFEKA